MKWNAPFVLLMPNSSGSCRMRARRLPALILPVVLALSRAVTGATVAFTPAVSYPVGTNPVAIAAGDLNGDGKMDLAVVASGDPATGDDGGVSILLGNGDRTFGAATNISPGKRPNSIAVADFNGDHRLDLAVINPDAGAGRVTIFLGNGDGTFQDPVEYATGNGPKMVAVGDLNGDQKLDLVIPNAFDGTVSVLLGNGDGTFQSRVDSQVGSAPQEVAIADLDANGEADLVVPSLKAGVALLLGNGDGTFHPAAFEDLGLAFGPVRAVSGDFNGDGKLDLMIDYFVGVTCCPAAGRFRGDLLAGNGDGTFHVVQGVATLGGNVSHADFNGDWKLDLVAVSPNGGASVSLGNGDGTFQNPGVSLAVGSIPSAVMTADLNGDKSPDIVVANAGDNTISVLLNTLGTDSSVSASAATPATLRAGQTATSTISLELLNAFDSPVSLTCSVQPVQAGSPSCSFGQNPAVFDASGKASAQMNVSLGAETASLAGASTGSLLCLPVVGFIFTVTSLRSTSRRSKHLVLVTLLLFSALLLLAGCGGGAPRSLQTYTITVTGTAGTASHSTSINVTVQ
jgi:hypothetical protein